MRCKLRLFDGSLLTSTLMDRDEPITKRLHISGLTPALTPADLSKRLGTYGKVHALDGFGLSDGIGQPRKFGYVTIESTQGQLAKCAFMLSRIFIRH